MELLIKYKTICLATLSKITSWKSYNTTFTQIVGLNVLWKCLIKIWDGLPIRNLINAWLILCLPCNKCTITLHPPLFEHLIKLKAALQINKNANGASILVLLRKTFAVAAFDFLKIEISPQKLKYPNGWNDQIRVLYLSKTKLSCSN